MGRPRYRPCQSLKENMKVISETEVDQVSGGLDGWQFAGALSFIAGATVAIVAAPAVGAIGGLFVLGGVGLNAIASYA